VLSAFQMLTGITLLVKGEGRMLSLLAQTAVSFVATVSFAILFQVPREQYVYSGLCGAAGWLCYLLVMQNYPSPAVASFAAVVVLTVMSRIFAVRRKTPVTIFLICGIFPLVPGAGIYYTAYNFIIGNNQMAVAKGVETIKIAVAIALAVVFTFSLPTPVFRFAKSRKGKMIFLNRICFCLQSTSADKAATRIKRGAALSFYAKSKRIPL